MTNLQSDFLGGIGFFPLTRCESCKESVEKNFNALVENFHGGIIVTTRSGTIIYANTAAARLMQRDPDALAGMVFGYPLIEGKSTEIEMSRPDGTKTALEMQVTAIQWEEGSWAYYAVSLHDISPYRNLRTALQKSNDRLQSLISASPLAIVTLDSEKRVMLWSRVAEKLFGWNEREVLGRPFPVLAADGQEEIQRYCNDAMQNEVVGIQLLNQRRRDGSTLDVRIWAAPLYGPQRLEGGVMLPVADVTENNLAEAEIQYLSNYDALTGLPNRAMFRAFMQDSLAQRSSGDGTYSALLYLGMDRFEHVNESLGGDNGDSLLRKISDRVIRMIRETDILSHVGGDEFVIFLPTIGDPQDAGKIAKKILQAFAEPFTVNELADPLEVFVSASLGVAIFPDDGRSAELLERNAESAMHRAKRNGGNQLHFFAPGMSAGSLEKLSLESSLRRALEREEFVLYYQPQLDIWTGELVGAEALIRWQPPGGELVLPGRFIPVAEECGLIVPLGEWVLRAACHQGMVWKELGFPNFSIAVNVSPLQFRRNIHKVAPCILAETGFEAHLLDIELTEGAVMHDPESAVVMLKHLKAQGVCVSIDDFGMGNSSLGYLKRFPIDKLKIDKNFIRDITTDPDDSAIVSAIISLARSMSLKVIAEGVETAAQLDYLRALECQQVQGYYFSKPLPAPEFAAFVQQQNRPTISP